MRNTISILFIVLLGLLFYGFTLRGILGNPPASAFKDNLDQATRPFELSPERGRYTHLIALSENNTYALDQELAENVYPDVGYYKGNFFSYFAPGISYMALPFYLLGEKYNLAQVATFAFVSLVSILALIFLFKIAREIFNLPIWASLFSVIVFAFGSTAWSYAITLYQHHLTAFFIVSGFYAVWRYKKATPWSWLWGVYVWLAYGLAIFIDYPNILLLLPIMIYFLMASLHREDSQNKTTFSLRGAFLTTSIIFILISGLHLYHNAYHFGSWKQLSGGLPSYKALIEAGLLEKSDIQTAIQVQAPQTKNVVGFFREENVPFSFYTLTTAPDRGLFLYAPIFLLSLFGIYALRKKITLEYATLLGLMGLNFLLYSSWGDPWGGWAYGPRYLIPSMAILSLFLGIYLVNIKTKILGKVIAYLLFLYSSAIALLGALTTNAVPPKIEGDYLNIKYNFLYNYDFLLDNKSGSFLYNTYFQQFLSLTEYFFILYAGLALIAFFILFILPLIKIKNG